MLEQFVLSVLEQSDGMNNKHGREIVSNELEIFELSFSIDCSLIVELKLCINES